MWGEGAFQTDFMVCANALREKGLQTHLKNAYKKHSNWKEKGISHQSCSFNPNHITKTDVVRKR